MNLHLIDYCYKNPFGIDLVKYHRNICRISDNERELLEKLNTNERIVFEDAISHRFRLELVDNLVFLMGDRTCYLCSHVIESAYGSDLNWVKCIAIPTGCKIKGETDIRKSGVIISMFSDLVPYIPSEKLFSNFAEQLEYVYSECNWFKRIHSMSLYVRIVGFWDYKQKIVRLFELGLLYPLELVMYALYKNVQIKSEFILKNFVNSLSESTNKIISFEEIRLVFKTLTESEIRDVLGMTFVAENINLDLLSDDYFADYLRIDVSTRYALIVNGIFNTEYAKKRAEDIFKVREFEKEYVKQLKLNFRALENKIRKNKGYEEVGSFIMEKLLYDKLNHAFPSLKFITQYSPNWLRPQRIDIFIEDCSLAIEYHGAQHYLPIDFFGGTNGLKLRQELDRKKKEKCYENEVMLVEISYEEDFDFAFEELKKLIESLL